MRYLAGVCSQNTTQLLHNELVGVPGVVHEPAARFRVKRTETGQNASTSHMSTAKHLAELSSAGFRPAPHTSFLL